MVSSNTSGRVTDNHTPAMASSPKEERKPVSVPDILPDVQTGDAVVSDVLIPMKHDSSAAEAGYDHTNTPRGSRRSDGFANWDLPVELVSLLDVTADKILRESCGEGWLMQSRIADMTRLEYRVYMLNGSQAVSDYLNICTYMCWDHAMQLTADMHCGVSCHALCSRVAISLGSYPLLAAWQCIWSHLLMHKLSTCRVVQWHTRHYSCA